MGSYIADRLVKLMTKSAVNVVDSRVLVLGLSFKENCPDIRNTKVMDVIRALEDYNINVDVYDPWVDPVEACHEYRLNLVPELKPDHYDACVLAVAHQEFVEMGSAGIREHLKDKSVLFDVKSVLPAAEVSGRL
jgi:UDP-N-acetyl-D-galactosamine dehydrogenase